MATAHTLPARARRDVTNAVTLTQTLRRTFDANRTNPTFSALEEILRNLDARSGRREKRYRHIPIVVPTSTTAKRATKRGKKTAKRARTARARR
jgi:hypothetical protein